MGKGLLGIKGPFVAKQRLNVFDFNVNLFEQKNGEAGQFDAGQGLEERVRSQIKMLSS